MNCVLQSGTSLSSGPKIALPSANPERVRHGGHGVLGQQTDQLSIGGVSFEGEEKTQGRHPIALKRNQWVAWEKPLCCSISISTRILTNNKQCGSETFGIACRRPYGWVRACFLARPGA